MNTLRVDNMGKCVLCVRLCGTQWMSHACCVVRLLGAGARGSCRVAVITVFACCLELGRELVIFCSEERSASARSCLFLARNLQTNVFALQIIDGLIERNHAKFLWLLLRVQVQDIGSLFRLQVWVKLHTI